MSSPMSSSCYRTKMMNSMRKIASVDAQFLHLPELSDMLKPWVHAYVQAVYQVEVQRRILCNLCTFFLSQIIVHL